MKRKILRMLLMGAVLAALVGLVACGGSEEPEAGRARGDDCPNSDSRRGPGGYGAQRGSHAGHESGGGAGGAGGSGGKAAPPLRI